MPDEEMSREEAPEEAVVDDKYNFDTPTDDVPEIDDKPDASDTPEAPEKVADTPADDSAEDKPAPATEPDHSGDEPQEQLDLELVQRAGKLGISQTAMKKMGAADTRATVLQIENEQLRASRKPEPIDEPAPGIDLDKMEMDDEVREVLKAVTDRSEALTKRVEELSQGLDQDKAVTKRREQEAEFSRFDARIVKLGRKGEYGAGATGRMDATSPGFNARDELYRMQRGMQLAGFGEEEAFDKAVRARHAGDIKKEAVEEIAGKVNEQTKQVISKPSSGNRVVRQTGEEKALAYEAAGRKKFGMPPIDDTPEDDRF